MVTDLTPASTTFLAEEGDKEKERGWQHEEWGGRNKERA